MSRGNCLSANLHRWFTGDMGYEGCISSVPRIWKVQRAVPPHPNPLPWGEGEESATRSKTQHLPNFRALEMILPLPEGEGWGEGEGDVPTRINRLCSQDVGEGSE